MRSILFKIPGFLFGLLLCTRAFGLAEDFSGKVVAILDGDTIEVMHLGRAEKVRLSGIDCPEKAQAFGTRARQFTADLVFRKEVMVKTSGRDRNGRMIGEVLLPDGRNLNRELLKAGFAWWFKRYSQDRGLKELEAEARAAKRGLWTDQEPVPPWEFRRQRMQRQ